VAEGSGWSPNGCRLGDTEDLTTVYDPVDQNGDLIICRTPDGQVYDNRTPKRGGWTTEGCRRGDTIEMTPTVDDPVDKNGDLLICRTPDGQFYDNR
jgi:hypothetical protein